VLVRVLPWRVFFRGRGPISGVALFLL